MPTPSPSQQPGPPLELVLLDVNETLFSLQPVADRMAEIGLDGRLELWFTRILRDGFAAAAADSFVGFRELAEHHLLVLLRREHLTATATEVAHVLGGFDEVVPHPDVASGLADLRRADITAVALTNGSAEITRGFLDRSGLAELVDDVRDVGEAGRWKPAPEPYLLEVERRGSTPRTTAMIAVHPWDLYGARSAGLITAWLDRDGVADFPSAFGTPDVHAATLGGLVDGLLDRPRV